MFIFDRSAAAVILPLALLVAVVLWSGRSASPAADTAHAPDSHATTVAQADDPHVQGG